MAKRKSKKKRDIKVYLIVIWTLFVLFGVGIYLLFHGIVNEWFGQMPTFEELENPETNLATEIISSDGKLLGSSLYMIFNCCCFSLIASSRSAICRPRAP